MDVLAAWSCLPAGLFPMDAFSSLQAAPARYPKARQPPRADKRIEFLDVVMRTSSLKRWLAAPLSLAEANPRNFSNRAGPFARPSNKKIDHYRWRVNDRETVRQD